MAPVATIDFSRLENALSTTRGLVELALVLACVAVAAFVRFRFRRRYPEDPTTRTGRIAIGLYPLLLLVMVVVARAGFARSGPTFFLDLAIPLVVALAVINVLVYTVRRLFPSATWLAGSERLIAFAIFVVVALHYLGVTAELVEMLESMTFQVGRTKISLYTIGQGLVVVVVTIAVSLWLSGFVERRMSATAMDANTRVVFAKFFRAILVVVGVLIALPAIGIDLTLLSVFGGALGVGIGLGLQKLAANYIAGFAILLDKSIKLGDVVTADGRHGEVTRFTSRYVVVRQFDGVEAIVPNETLVTTTVLNHAHASALARLVVPLQVPYEADLDRVLLMLVEAARAQPSVILVGDRAPQAHVVGFGDSGIALEVTLWSTHAEGGMGPLRTAVLRRMADVLRSAGIAIPPPKRDIRLSRAPPAREGPGEPPQAPSAAP